MYKKTFSPIIKKGPHYSTNRDLNQCFRLLFNQVTVKNRDQISIRKKYASLVGETREETGCCGEERKKGCRV